MGRRFLRGVLAAATAGIGVGMLTPMAADAAVVCGQTITTSTTLDTDLVCPQDGILVNASNVTLDLAGHTISGPAQSGGLTFFRGVAILPNRTGVTVRNGTIRAFDRGVSVSSGATGSVVSGLTFDSNGIAVDTSLASSGTAITGDSILNSARNGIQLGGNGNRVEDNTLASVGGTGVLLSGNQNVVRGNRILDAGANAVGTSTFGGNNPGPFVGNRILSNQILGSGRLFNSVAISIAGGSGTVVDGNNIVGRRATPGVFVLDSANTVVSTNNLDANSTGVLLRGSSSGTQIVGNLVAQSSFSGIAVESGTTATLVSGNTSNANGGNGIDVRSPSSTITGNTARSNGGLGIFAVNGVTDGGGNKASGNGNPAQCTPNIACT